MNTRSILYLFLLFACLLANTTTTAQIQPLFKSKIVIDDSVNKLVRHIPTLHFRINEKDELYYNDSLLFVTPKGYSFTIYQIANSEYIIAVPLDSSQIHNPVIYQLGRQQVWIFKGGQTLKSWMVDCEGGLIQSIKKETLILKTATGKKRIPLKNFRSAAYSSGCRISPTYTKNFSFGEGSLKQRIYDTVKYDTLNNHLLWVKSYDLSGMVEILHLKADLADNANIKLVKDSTVINRQINLSDSLHSRLFRNNMTAGFYWTECKNNFSHINEMLVISTPGNKKWIEVVSDNRLEDVLTKVEDFAYLKDIIAILPMLAGKKNKN